MLPSRMYSCARLGLTLIETCKLNDVDPQAWLADILARLPDHPVKQFDELLPWTWNKARQLVPAAAARTSAPGKIRKRLRFTPDAYTLCGDIRRRQIANGMLNVVWLGIFG
jgi:IS66 C-terminal element